jgi:hypothetical protein
MYVVKMLSLTELCEPCCECYCIERNTSAILSNFLLSTKKMADVGTFEAGAILAPHA